MKMKLLPTPPQGKICPGCGETVIGYRIHGYCFDCWEVIWNAQQDSDISEWEV